MIHNEVVHSIGTQSRGSIGAWWGLLGCALVLLAPNALMAQGSPLELLGKTLFWDEQLSSSGTVACGSCHQPAFGGTDPRAERPGAGQDPRESGSLHPGYDGLFGTADDAVGSPGVVRHRADGSPTGGNFALRSQTTGRKSPSNLTAAFNSELFWDGRAGGALVDPLTGTTVQAFGAAIETQALGPPVSDVEMAHAGESWASVATRIQGARPLASASRLPPDVAAFVGTSDYPTLFSAAFGGTGVTPVRIAQAIAAYQRSLAVFDTPFDQFQAGNHRRDDRRTGARTTGLPDAGALRCVVTCRRMRSPMIRSTCSVYVPSSKTKAAVP